MTLRFTAETPNGKKKVSFRDIYDLESKIGLQYERSDDGLINLVPDDDFTKNTMQQQKAENAQALALVGRKGALSVNSPFLSHVKRDSMKAIIVGRLELFQSTQYGDSLFVKDNALSLAIGQLTNTKEGGLITQQREGVSFVYDEKGKVGVAHDRLLESAPTIGNLRRRDLVPSVPNITEYYYPGGDVAARINANGDDLSSARSELYRFDQHYKQGTQLLKADMTVRHPEFKGKDLDHLYTRELDKLKKEHDMKGETPDDMQYSIERPKLKPV